MKEIPKNIEGKVENKYGAEGSFEEIDQNKNEKEDFSRQVEYIKEMYKTAAQKFLSQNPELQSKVTDFFVDRLDVNKELTYLLENKTDQEREEYMDWLESVLNDENEFQSRMEMIFERKNIQEKYSELNQSTKIATEEEYEMGVFIELLEDQVREAVVEANKKGYKTFQSGFSEKDPKNQFMDVYNKNISIPEELIKTLEEKGVDVSVENFDDRTTITLHPTKQTFKMAEWKEIWNSFIQNLPEADKEMVENYKEPGLHKDFRNKQDALRKIYS